MRSGAAVGDAAAAGLDHGNVGPVETQQVRQVLLGQPAGVPVAEQDRSQFPPGEPRPVADSQDAAAISAPAADGRAGTRQAAQDAAAPDGEPGDPHRSQRPVIPSP
jgi:hypothetical protein